MKKLILFFLFAYVHVHAQIESGLLFGLTTGTTAEINAATGMQEGQMLYNTETRQVLIFNGTQWTSAANSNWLSNGNVLDTGNYLGSTNDVALDLRSNARSIIQLGRRETLGLLQNFADYDDTDQYIAYLRGNNGVSALQFQADAANFYKPMFFTTPEGNFRLKGSAATSDFFEIGSNGVSNAGELEFIIGDDGAEPFIFKRYDHRDFLKKELFRIQGASNSLNALPRVGINTGQLANSTLEVNGSVATAINSTSGNLTLNETHHTVILTSSGNISLPTADSCPGRKYVIKNQSNTPSTVSTYVDTNGNNRTAIRPNSTLDLQSDGTSWHSFSRNTTTMKFFETQSGRAYFYNNTWYSPSDFYFTSTQHWNQNKGTGATPNYNTSNQSGIPIASAVTLNKFVMKNDFNATPTGIQRINISVLRNGTFINIGTYTLTGLSTTVSMQTEDVNFELLESDLLTWSCHSTNGASRVSYASITFEFGY